MQYDVHTWLKRLSTQVQCAAILALGCCCDPNTAVRQLVVFHVQHQPVRSVRYERFTVMDIGLASLDQLPSHFPTITQDSAQFTSMVTNLSQRCRQEVGDEFVAQAVFAVAIRAPDTGSTPLCFLFTFSITKDMVAPLKYVGPGWKDIMYMWMLQKLA